MLRQGRSGEVDAVSRRRAMTDAELRRARDMAFARMRAADMTLKEIATYHRVSIAYVHKRLAALPESARRRAEAIA